VSLVERSPGFFPVTNKREQNMKHNAKPAEKRFSATLQLRAPPRLFPLIDKAADRRCMTPSEYVRQSIVERLKADGIELEAV
jgi:predicted HicB family RNase H-like nuclease